MAINICCPYFGVLPCHDTEEHKHITCDPKSGLDDSIISNEQAKKYCLSERDEFIKCPYFPRNG
jgi:hypothetical protein